MNPPQNPAGEFTCDGPLTPQGRAERIAILAAAPAALEEVVAGLDAAQLGTSYRNWTVRQIVHHLADSHLNAYLRFKWTLTEDTPTIKPYDEGRWSALGDARSGPIGAPLALYGALHARWLVLLDTMSDADYAREYYHPESQRTFRLDTSLAMYAHHARHHTAQIRWLRQQHGW